MSAIAIVHSGIDPFALQQAEVRASRMVGCYGFTTDDWEDLRQEMLLDYLERQRHFDPRRGDQRGFIFGVVRNRAAQLLARQQRRPVPVPADGIQVQGEAKADYDLSLDVAAALSRLPEHLRAIALMLVEKTPRELAAETGKSRSRIYQLIDEIRGAFEEAGLSPERVGETCRGGAR